MAGRAKKKRFCGFKVCKIWQIADKKGRIMYDGEYFTYADAELMLSDFYFVAYKEGYIKEAEQKGYHIVKDKNKAREIYAEYQNQ